MCVYIIQRRTKRIGLCTAGVFVGKVDGNFVYYSRT